MNKRAVGKTLIMAGCAFILAGVFSIGFFLGQDSSPTISISTPAVVSLREIRVKDADGNIIRTADVSGSSKNVNLGRWLPWQRRTIEYVVAANER